jgi:uncharacterized protein (DUF2249 family)
LISFKDNARTRDDDRYERSRLPEAVMLATPIQSDAPPVYAFDARGVARRLRQPAIIAAIDALRIGETLRLTHDADPQRLLEQVDERYAGRVAYHYVERAAERVVIDFARS